MRRHAWNCDLSTKPGTDILTNPLLFLVLGCPFQSLILRKRQPESARECVFSCVLSTCNGLACSLQSHLCRSLPFLSLLQFKKKRQKQKRNGLHTPREGRFRELGPIIFFCVCVFCFLLFLVCFLRPYGEGLADKKVAGPNYLPLLPPQALQTCFWLFIVCWGLRFH